jgi:hypothetical protein
MNIGIDFDGTCVTHEFPKIGIDIGAVPILKKLVDNGHRLILFTMRSDMKKITTDDPNVVPVAEDYLTQAVDWFKENDIPLWGIQTNPQQHSWTESPKAFCDLYIDDAGLGIPLSRKPVRVEAKRSKTYPREGSLNYHPTRAYVDWDKVKQLLIEMNII